MIPKSHLPCGEMALERGAGVRDHAAVWRKGLMLLFGRLLLGELILNEEGYEQAKPHADGAKHPSH